ncbi:DUF1893 domain-containing protein [candidate division KSB1 bacterium]|nr:DUF1893 domain-containing protein [candidate division KSB1 bacterium]MBL7094546.1 DUF1893 domain-containing protein [candidate division KSB1 bacterium]
MAHTLEVYLAKNLIFHSDGKWLHPLLELDKFLSNKEYDQSKLLVKDKIVGRAAALILVCLGIQNVKAGILSKPGMDVLKKYRVNYKYKEIVDRIQCRTEEMLKNEFDPNTAYKLINKLASSANKG